MAFELTDGIRGALPLLIGLAGPSRSGKTFSALRLALGIQRVCGGDIGVIDTESRRALHYGLLPGEAPAFGKFRFKHLHFGAPFCPLRYLEAFEYVLAKGCKTIIIDSMSLEHEGAGGVLEQHEEETTRLMNEWHVSRGKAQMSAWGAPKAKRTKMMLGMVGQDRNVILCFRGKDKIKMLKADEQKEAGTKDPIQEQGWMPIGGEELLYEMSIRALLLPGAAGVPTWTAEMPGEKKWIGMEDQFKPLFTKPRPLDEAHGQALADWAAGGSILPDGTVDTHKTKADPNRHADKVKTWVQAIEAADSAEAVETIAAEARKLAGEMTAKQKQDISAAKKEAEARLVPAGRMAGED